MNVVFDSYKLYILQYWFYDSCSHFNGCFPVSVQLYYITNTSLNFEGKCLFLWGCTEQKNAFNKAVEV